ncbi:MAG: flavin reductase family protein [Gammaproteobacteria bacterium]
MVQATGTAAQPGLEARGFRQALARFPTGVIVATAWDDVDGRYIGMTMSSFSPVSLDPPLVLFSIGRRALSLPAWCRVPGYAINVLALDQLALCERFARPHASKWEGIEFGHGHHRAPLLQGALASFECLPHAQCDGGDHVTFFGRVVQFAESGVGTPLVVYGSRFVSIEGLESRQPENAVSAAWPLPIHY